MQQLPVRLITIPFRRIPSRLAVAGQPADSATSHQPYPVPYLSKYLTAARLRVDRLVALGVLVCSAKCQ